MGGNVNDFDLSDVPTGTVVKGAKDVMTGGQLATGVLKFVGTKIATNVATKVLLAIPEMELNRIIAENDTRRAYEKFIKIMDAIAKERRGACLTDELSDTCPMAYTSSQVYQTGKNIDGTAAYRLYTIIGDDGETIVIQGYDLLPRINMTVRHKNGRILCEDVSPKNALLLMRWLAGVSSKL